MSFGDKVYESSVVGLICFCVLGLARFSSELDNSLVGGTVEL